MIDTNVHTLAPSLNERLYKLEEKVDHLISHLLPEQITRGIVAGVHVYDQERIKPLEVKVQMLTALLADDVE
jgi:hypothetical protein